MAQNRPIKVWNNSLLKGSYENLLIKMAFKNISWFVVS